jgi:prolyl oligopeptidase
VPFKEGGRYFLTKNDGLQNQGVLYTMTALEAEPRVLLDPNKLSADGTVALSGIRVSEDGNLLAYGISSGGSDWQEWHVRDVRTGEDLADRVQWVKFSAAEWTKDGKGFFYARYEQPDEKTKLTKPNLNQKLYYHRLGAPQAEDKLVYERPDQPEWGFGAQATDDGHYLVLSVSRGTDPKNNVFYLDLFDPNAKAVELLAGFLADFTLIETHGTTFWFKTDFDAPRGRIIAIDIARPERANWREIVPQAADALEGVSMVGDQFFVSYLHDAASAVRVFGRDGRLVRELALPGLGTAGGFTGRRTDRETFYSFTSFAVPPRVYRLDVTSDAATLFREAKVGFNPDDFETKQVFYRSKDGTRVPMFITSRKSLKLDGKNPVRLYGYGGFRISLTPAFSPANLAWLEMGGVYAVPNLRGGGEYGEDWHLAGTREHKQNVFDDFIVAAEWLIANKYTSPDRLAIEGGSNGGLLVGACLTQRPELFGAAIPAVGVLDMLRYHKFTIGWAWASDYGTSDNADEFKSLYAYSPLQNVKPGTKYPATLILTADHDDRVVPAHSFKFAATMQAAQAGSKPVLIRIDTRAGHGAGKPTAKLIEDAADRFAFLVRELKVQPLPSTR